MPINKVELKNCKSIKSLQIPFNHINCLLGENGTGKTNILKSVKYFYDNLTEKNSDDSLRDKVNPFIESFEISFFYDFSRLQKIADSHSERRDIFGYRLNPIFKKIKNINKKYSDHNGDIKITLNQDKDGIQKWNVPFEIRAFIKNIFPIYFSQTRHLNLINWDDLWEIIGELSKIGVAENTSYKEELEECFKSAFGERYSTILNYIKTEFENNDIEIKAFNSNQQFANIYQLQLGGNSFKHKFEDLKYFSDGVNSYNYLKLLINLVSKISDRKIKEPTIIIDEPEIGLHPRYLDEMVDVFYEKSDHIKILLSTHSSRMIKNLMKDNSKVNLYHISMENKYSKLKRMRGFTDKREHNIVTEQEASYYFAKKIVFVEGPTELELFSNKNIINLFPFLKKVDFYAYESNSVKLKTLHPHEKNISIPYLIILDLDQILKYDKNTSKFSIKKGDKFTNPLKDKESEKKELLYYGSKREKTYNTRKRILGLTSKSKFYFDTDWGYILGVSSYFNLLRNLIRSYSLEYNIFPVLTTIEGSIINRNNHKIVYQWLRESKQKLTEKQIVDTIYNFKNSSAYKTTVLRLVNDGKFDNLETIKEWLGKVDNISDQNIKDIFDNIALVKNSKTNGWVTDFFDYFFDNYITIKELTHEGKIDIFRKNFPEIYMIVTSIKNINKK
ncbi:retron Eco8 family effector endonuclease [Cytobacillus firmus]|uniref:Retron Eco8 family effector endonuclease n=1 Tax=Cytobacillus firmus TaxID=1399 RepID=A0AA46P8W4_CYTFI|nr:retron Eco8 family effector endonuclease [Cytobacillus firmus]UYG95326.1 retron Eco8 family effector endonuclease [Cytobacillus firmus]